MTTRQVQIGFLVIMLTVIGVSVDLGYRLGKRNADKWWKTQPERIITKIEYREGPALKVYVGKDGEEYDATLRGWVINSPADLTSCIVVPGNSRILAEDISFEVNIPNEAGCRLTPAHPKLRKVQ